MSINAQNSVRKLPLQGLAEKREAAPKLALLDDFDGDPKGFPHGQAVESVLLHHSELADADIQRYQSDAKQADLVKLMREDGLDFVTAYRTMVGRNIAHFYLNTATNVQQILTQQPTVRAISQSQGETPGRQLEGLFAGLKDNSAFRQGAIQALGLPEETPLAKVCEKLLTIADLEASQSEICQKAKEHFDRVSKTAYEKGVTYLVAGGNHGDIGRTLESIGVEPSPSSFRNVLVNDWVTVIGALTTDGQVSTINSPGAAIEAYRRGEELEWSAAEGFDQSGVDSGTSFATPIAAAEVLEFLAKNPQAGPFETEAFLAGLDSSLVRAGQEVSTSNGQSLKGDGKLEDYISQKIGTGFLTDVTSPDVTQIAQASQPSAFFGLPGAKDHEFQLVKMRTDGEGQRRLTIDTYFNEGHHVLKAVAEGQSWDPESVVEELHLDPKRQREIEQKEAANP